MGELLSQKQKEAWVGLLFVQARLVRRMNEEFQSKDIVPMDVYDVLLSLEDAEDRRLTMSDLMDVTVLSPSGVTRLVDRMEKQGWVRREINAKDRRSMYAVLTDAGYAERVRAWPHYRQAIHNHFGVHISEDEAGLLSEIWGRLVEFPRYDN